MHYEKGTSVILNIVRMLVFVCVQNEVVTISLKARWKSKTGGHTLSSSSISEILRSIARRSRFSISDNVFLVVALVKRSNADLSVASSSSFLRRLALCLSFSALIEKKEKELIFGTVSIKGTYFSAS